MTAPHPPLVFVVLAVFRPDPEHLRAQLVSLRGQTHRTIRLIAVAADTVSEALIATEAGALDLDLVSVSCDTSQDAVRAFELGLETVLAQPEMSDRSGVQPLVALCDQDDIWRADRLEKGIAALNASGAQMVHSDACLVAQDGTTTLQPSMFAFERRHRRPGLRGLLYRNNVTGMTLLMRADLVRLALPFPPQSGVHFYHDLWLALLAELTGGVHLIDAPLVDYRQHGSNAIGAVDRQAGWLRAGKRRRPDMMWLRREAAAYALARYLAQAANNRMVDAVADGRLPHGKAHLYPLRPFLSRFRGAGLHLWDALRLGLTGNTGLARIAAGFAVVNVSRAVWILREALGPGLNAAVDHFDTRLYSLSPGMLPPVPVSRVAPDTSRAHIPWDSLTDRRKTPGWGIAFDADTAALCILVPTLNPTEIFAGIATALDIGLGLAVRGFQVRFIATDLPVSSVAASRRFLIGRMPSGAHDTGAAGRISLHCGVQSDTLAGHRDDVFFATAWWSAHVADRLIRSHGLNTRRFFYLIQDHEPNFYAWGPEYADASASYHFDFEPVFNTTLLRDYFATRGFDFASGDALAFHPSIDIALYAAPPRPTPVAGAPRRLAVYGRPEVARNMYATAIEALALFIESESLDPDQIELVSIGLQHAAVRLPRDLSLTSLGKLPWEDYPRYLRSVDVGLSLMYSPHPSHPPLEMAAAGVRVVTNGFGPKNLSHLSGAILSTAPTAPALADALRRAWHAGPVSAADRDIDLSHLGLDMTTLLDRLSDRLAGQLPRGDPQDAP